MKFWKKLILGLLLVLPLSLCFIPIPSSAASEFNISANVFYNVLDSGKTAVTRNITIENKISNLYAKSNTLILENISADNIKAYGQNGESYAVDVTRESGKITIKVNFPDDVVGKGAKREYTIYYENSSFTVRTGEVWEISIPRAEDQSEYQSYSVTLKIPKSFGLEAYISPKPLESNISDDGYLYKFSTESLLQSGISAGFGQFQVFSFNLSYHLENPLSRTSSTQIALPPDTAFQKVYIQKIDPAPSNVTVDDDGNWIATYELDPRERVDIVAVGSVQIFASYRSFPKPSNEALNQSLKSSQYWELDDPKIKELATQLKTPRAIYNYVSQTLHYNSDRVQPNVQRMGASAILNDPNNAICMEFTDLFIALSRAAGIPAREVNGYAYTENPELQPLGLVADVLHSWPEYYDKDKGVWIPVDPTWGSTSGIDYFDKLDLRHFAFVIHGESSTMPYPPGSYKLGPNPQKDVFVSFGKLPENKISIPKVTIEPYRVLPFFSSVFMITVKNPGPGALYSLSPTVYYDSLVKLRESISVLPPYSSKQIEVTIPHSFLGKDMPNIIKVEVGSVSDETLTNKKQIVIDSLLVVTFALVVIVVFILIKVKKVNIFGFFAKILTLRKKKDEKYDTLTEKTKSNP